MLTRRSLLVHLAAAPSVVAAACQSTGYEEPKNVEITAVMSVPRDAVGAGRYESVIYGTGDDGHTHDVVIEGPAMQTLAQRDAVVVRSGPASTDGHRHWLRATIA